MFQKNGRAQVWINMKGGLKPRALMRKAQASLSRAHMGGVEFGQLGRILSRAGYYAPLKP